jgi:tetratricopeptide (TPR) repeat protein
MRDLAAVYKLQAEIYGNQKKAEKALEALKIYVAHRPDDQEASDLLETLKPPEEPPSPIKEGPSLEEFLGTMVAVPEEGELPEIATPTLAEIYFKQGQVREAVKVYEKVVAIDPQDERSGSRLEEFRAMMAADLEKADQEVDRLIDKKERMIAILESWLSNIRENISSPASA